MDPSSVTVEMNQMKLDEAKPAQQAHSQKPKGKAETKFLLKTPKVA
jgi:hypothetical protein